VVYKIIKGRHIVRKYANYKWKNILRQIRELDKIYLSDDVYNNYKLFIHRFLIGVIRQVVDLQE